MNPKTIFKSLWACFFLLLLYWMIRLWGHFPAFMDTMEYVFPEKWFNVESFHQGRIPLWNPYIAPAHAYPHLAAFQPAPFLPLFWIWNLTGLTDWFFVIALLHQAFAAVGFYFWGRSLKASPLVATFCALGFAGSALMTFYWGFPTHLASVSWIPWIFFTLPDATVLKPQKNPGISWSGPLVSPLLDSPNIGGLSHLHFLRRPFLDGLVLLELKGPMENTFGDSGDIQRAAMAFSARPMGSFFADFFEVPPPRRMGGLSFTTSIGPIT